MLVFDLHSAMLRLIRRVMALYLDPIILRSTDVTEVPYSDASAQLTDNDVGLGTAARTLLESKKDHLTAVEVSDFFRLTYTYDRHDTPTTVMLNCASLILWLYCNTTYHSLF